MAAPPPPIPSKVAPKKYQRGQKIALESENCASDVPEWFSNPAHRVSNSREVYTVITRDETKGLGIIQEIIQIHDVPHNKVIVAFDIDRTLRKGSSSGVVCRDINTNDILNNLTEKGTTLWLITGAHADSNPAAEDATIGAIDRLKPIGLDKFFVDETTPLKETIVKTTDWQIRYRGRIIVSMEKDAALDYYLCCVSGILDKNGKIQQQKSELFIFVDDSDVHVHSVYNKFKNSAYFSIPVVTILFEPSLEMFRHNPTEGDNPKPGIIEQIYQNQIERFRITENMELIRNVYEAHHVALPQKYF